MSLRSSFTKLVGSLSSRSSRAPSRTASLRVSWAVAAGIAGVMAASATGCGGCNSSSLECDSNGQNCQICDAYGCRPADPETTGAGGSGGASPGTGGTGGTTTSSTTTTGDTGAGGSTAGDLACDTTKLCPEPQVCLPDGYCHYPCDDLLNCKDYDNRFTACVSGYCEE
jgi:hypothetical protein